MCIDRTGHTCEKCRDRKGQHLCFCNIDAGCCSSDPVFTDGDQCSSVSGTDIAVHDEDANDHCDIDVMVIGYLCDTCKRFSEGCFSGDCRDTEVT